MQKQISIVIMKIQKQKLRFKDILEKGRPFFFRKKHPKKRNKIKFQIKKIPRTLSKNPDSLKENLKKKPSPSPAPQPKYLLRLSYNRQSNRSRNKNNKKTATSHNRSWRLSHKPHRHQSANHTLNRSNAIGRCALNMSVNKPPKRLSQRAKGLFIKSFLRPRRRADRPQSFHLSLKRRRPRVMSAAICASKKPAAITAKIEPKKPEVKDPFTPKFSVLSKLKKAVNIDMNRFCSRFLTPFAREIDSLHAQFNSIHEIGRGSYAVAFSAVDRSGSGELVVKQLKLNLLTKISKIKRFLVDERINPRPRSSCCGASGRRRCRGCTRYISTRSTCT